MQIHNLVPLGPKVTMKIGGKARYFADLKTPKDAEEAHEFAQKQNLPLIALGAGSNTIFADGIIEAVVVTVKANAFEVNGSVVRAEAGLPLATLVTKLIAHGLDLSALTGIPGTVGGAIFGNAGQGPQGVWLDHFVDRVTAFVDGEWKSLTRSECQFKYRESIFKHWPPSSKLQAPNSPLIWEVLLEVPKRPKAEITADIDRLLKRRLEAQPFARTAGSCFKALPDGTPAWKAIEAAELKGKKIGGVGVSEKHANFLISQEGGTFADTLSLVAEVREKTKLPMELEMRLIDEEGKIVL